MENFITEYKKMADAVDQCDNEEILKEYQNSMSWNAIKKEFWKQRQVLFKSSDSLEKQKARVKLRWIQNFFGSSIPMKRTIRKFTAPNGITGIIITPEATLGENCVIFQHVYIGADTLPDSPNAGVPSIGNNVYIGAGAKIFGNVIIGDNVRIDANCCVTTDIPANSHVINKDSCVVLDKNVQDNRYISPQQWMDNYFTSSVYDYSESPEDSELTVQKAAVEDIDAIIQLYKDRVLWLKWKKFSQWGSYLIHHPKEEFLQCIENGEYYIVKKENDILGGFVLTEDYYCWPDHFSEAFYLRKVVTSTRYKKLGNYIVAEARKLTEAAGKKVLRLECVFSNEELNTRWENLGFAFVQEIEYDYHFSLREMNFTNAEGIPQPTDNI